MLYKFHTHLLNRNILIIRHIIFIKDCALILMNKSNNSTEKTLTPVVFMTHGVPSDILNTETTRFTESKKFADKFLKGKIKAIICISAHYFEDKIEIISSDNPGTYHDHGFDNIFDFVWKAKGSKEISQEIFSYLKQKGFDVALNPDRGFDHGCWLALYPFGIDKDDFSVPVIQISLPSDENINKIIQLGQAFKYFRENKDYLIIGSGSITHNIRLMMQQNRPKSTVDKINQFKDDFYDICLNYTGKNRIEKMLELTKNANFRLAHPTNDHFLPILIVLSTASDLKGNIMWEDLQYEFKLGSFYFN